ncbi:hypothetical protein DPMN_082276 [Dreissena polymorpha]|uniref:Uncharacterized protein n=1 Tax=Dreissena polymorpha TaxID=45954 RepID=A0A9D3Y7B6_DREPO|nr:hypothetical protein DPMN_082276 [Dreissena polymorpha]
MVLCDNRREFRKLKYKSLHYRANYQKANKEVRKKTKDAMEEWIKEQCIIIDKVMIAGSGKEADSTIKTHEDQSAQAQCYIRR